MSRPPRRVILGTLALAIALLAAWADRPPAVSQVDDPLARAESHLRSAAGRLGIRPDLADLQPTDVRTGLSSDHVRYRQTVRGVPVFGGSLTVSLPRDRRALTPPLVTGRYEPPAAAAPPVPRVALRDALRLVDSLVGTSEDNLRGAVAASLVYYPIGDEKGRELVLAWQVVAPTVDPLASWLFVLRADDGRILLRQDLLRGDSGHVFDPNPAKSSGGLIPPPSNCDTAANAAALAGQRALRTLRGINSGQNRLIGEFVDLTAPGIRPLGAGEPGGPSKTAGQANEPSRNFAYGCDDDRFEEVMVYYHVDTVQRKIQALGFTGASGIIDRPISAHAHYFTDCNAFFDPATLGMHFGDGDGCSPSADSAEDADVIIHEYGHAIHHDQVPGWGFGPAAVVAEAGAMGEGFGDFLAAAVFGDPCLGEWFSVGGSACGGSPGLRTLDNSAFYNSGSVTSLPSWCSDAGDVHCTGLVWGGALWDLVEALGGGQTARDTVLTLVLDSHFYLDPQATFAEAAAAIRQADSLLYGGAHVSTIDSVFSARGISSTGAVSDFPYAFLRIVHTFRGDLEVNVKVGPNPSSPLCTINIWTPNAGDPADNLVGFQSLSGGTCSGFLPPSPSTPWRLEVRDVFPTDTGSIEQFEVVLSGATRCIATGVPVPIPDNDGYVYATVDCSTAVGPPGDNDGDTVLDVIDTDDDNDGFSDADELAIGTNHLDRCADTPAADDEADDKWPPDFDDNRQINILDVVRLTSPVFGSDSTDPDYSPRADLRPNGVINILDIVRMTPPVFGSSCS